MAETEGQPFKFSGRLRSFRFAFRGIKVMLKTQHNAWIHACATILVIALGLLLSVSAAEWCWLIAAMMAVWTAEAPSPKPSKRSLQTELEWETLR